MPIGAGAWIDTTREEEPFTSRTLVAGHTERRLDVDRVPAGKADLDPPAAQNQGNLDTALASLDRNARQRLQKCPIPRFACVLVEGCAERAQRQSIGCVHLLACVHEADGFEVPLAADLEWEGLVARLANISPSSMKRSDQLGLVYVLEGADLNKARNPAAHR